MKIPRSDDRDLPTKAHSRDTVHLTFNTVNKVTYCRQGFQRVHCWSTANFTSRRSADFVLSQSLQRAVDTHCVSWNPAPRVDGCEIAWRPSSKANYNTPLRIDWTCKFHEFSTVQQIGQRPPMRSTCESNSSQAVLDLNFVWRSCWARWWRRRWRSSRGRGPFRRSGADVLGTVLVSLRISMRFSLRYGEKCMFWPE